MRESIRAGSFDAFVRGFLGRQFPAGDVPAWVAEALDHVGIQL